MTTDAQGTNPPSAHRRGWTLLLVSVTTFMLVLDITVVIVALPAMQADLHADLSGLQWVIDAYTLVLAALLLTAGTVGDRIGRKRLFLIGTVMFTAGSLACAVAPSASALDGLRVLQGIGGAALFGAGLPLLAAAYPAGRARNGAVAVFGAASGTAVALGPLVGGLLTQTLGWRAIFYLNVPIGILVLLAAWHRITESRDPTPRRPDWAGTATATAAALLLVFALVRGNAAGWGSPAIIALLAGAAVALAAFLLIELRVAEPMLDLGLFRNRLFAANACVAFTVQGTLVAALIYLSLYVQDTLGVDPVGAGIRLLPFTVVSFGVAVAAGTLLNRVPVRPLVAASAGFAGAGLIAMAHLNAGSTWTALIPGLVLAGCGLGLASTVVNQVALAAVPPERSGMASGVINTIKQVGVAAGVAGLGAIFASRVTAATARQLSGLPLPGGAVHALSTEVASGAGALVANHVPLALRPVVEHAARVGTTSGLDVTLIAAGGVALLAAVISLAFTRSRGTQSGATPEAAPPQPGDSTTPPGREPAIAPQAPREQHAHS